MQITKEFKIHEIRAAQISNAPFKIILESNFLTREQESSLTLNADTCARYNIPVSLDLIGRTLICSFESQDFPLENGRVAGKFGNDNLIIQSLKKTETASFIFYTNPPTKYIETSRMMNLSSFGGSDGIHFHILPCPFYQFFCELTEEEYEACKALSPASVFRISFRLA